MAAASATVFSTSESLILANVAAILSSLWVSGKVGAVQVTVAKLGLRLASAPQVNGGLATSVLPSGISDRRSMASTTFIGLPRKLTFGPKCNPN